MENALNAITRLDKRNRVADIAPDNADALRT
jgi:hypothetical protein